MGEGRRRFPEVQVSALLAIRSDVLDTAIGGTPLLPVHRSRVAQVWVGSEYEPVDDAEHRGVRADAERQRQDDRARKTRRSPQATNGRAAIMTDLVETSTKSIHRHRASLRNLSYAPLRHGVGPARFQWTAGSRRHSAHTVSVRVIAQRPVSTTYFVFSAVRFALVAMHEKTCPPGPR